MCILGEPTEGKVVLGHYGSLWLRISTRGNFIHTAFTEGKREQNSIVRMHDVLGAVLEWIPAWEDDPPTRTAARRAIVNVGAVQAASAGASRERRTAPTSSSTSACRRRRRWRSRGARCCDMVRGLQERFPEHEVEGEVYVTAPGAEIEEGHELVAAIDASHEEVFGRRPSAT